MDRIALISDIHGNMHALDAVLFDIKCRGINRIICLGDIVGKGPGQAEALDKVKCVCEAVVKGNWDDMVSNESDYSMVKWSQQILGAERIKYLRTLPYSLQFYMSGKLVRLFHSSAKGLYHRVRPEGPFEEHKDMFKNTENTGLGPGGREPDVVGYADIHGAYIKCFDGKILFNTGSVGNPLDMTQASYTVIEGVYNSAEPGSFSVQHIRVPYDVEKEIDKARKSGMPACEEYINELLTGRYRGLNSYNRKDV